MTSVRKITNPTEAEKALISSLWNARVIATPAAKVVALGGGVSSEIYLVKHTSGWFVVKRPLARLRVADAWFADPDRMQAEMAFLRVVGTWLPGRVPRILAVDPDQGWFAMEYFGPGWKNWKAELLQGRVARNAGAMASETLASVHSHSWKNPDLAREFAMGRSFRQLRLEPYFEATALRCPEVASVLRTEIDRLSETRLALIHGDFSPKNILLTDAGFVLLDAEVACFGDPSFDVAFLLCHLFLKALKQNLKGVGAEILELASDFWRGYTKRMTGKLEPDFEQRTIRLLLGLLLARIHGKSPIEYLDDQRSQEFVSKFAIVNLQGNPPTFDELATQWSKQSPRK